MTDFRTIYQTAFADPGYGQRNEDEFRYQYAADFVETYRDCIGSVLDLGSGQGTLLNVFRQRFPDLDLTSVDLQKFHDVDIRHVDMNLADTADIEKLRGFRADLVVCTDVLEHLPEHLLADVIAAIQRVAPFAVITVANHSDVHHGTELHLTQRPRSWWEDLIRQHFEVIDTCDHYNGRLYAFYLHRKPELKCSIVMSTYNAPKSVAMTLKSIALQEIPYAYEIIVVDDGSTGRCDAICEEYGARYFHLPDRPFYSNPSPARNVGCRAAKGEIIILQSAEVIHHSKDAIAKLVGGLQPGYFDLATTWSVRIDENGAPTTEIKELERVTRQIQYCGHDNPRPFFFLGAVYRTDLYSVGGNDEQFLYPGYDDNWLADCLIRGRGLQPRFRDDVIGYHIEHERPPWVGAVQDEMRNLYHAKVAEGKFVAHSGPWRIEN